MWVGPLSPVALHRSLASPLSPCPETGKEARCLYEIWLSQDCTTLASMEYAIEEPLS